MCTISASVAKSGQEFKIKWVQTVGTPMFSPPFSDNDAQLLEQIKLAVVEHALK